LKKKLSMKSEFDTEMDRLLRGHARRGGTRAGEGATHDPLRDALAGGRAARERAHLDADELSAFAEQALPDAARVRCAAHLADCDDCRRFAAQLALAAGGAVAREERAQVAPRIVVASWRERLASLVAPRAWRFAMPLVALLCVGVAALVLMKRVPRPGAAELARNEVESPPGSANIAGQDTQHATTVAPQTEPQAATATTNGATASAEVSTARDAAATATRNDQAASDDLKKAQAGGAVAGSGVGGANAPKAAAEPARIEAQPASPPATTAAPVMMATPIPVPMPTPAPDADEFKVAREAPKDKSAEEAERAETRRARGAGERGSASGGASPEQQRAQNRQTLQSQEVVTVAPGAKTESNTASRRKQQQRSATPRDEEEKSDAALAKPEGETRNAGGRKFRREGDAWIDTAYHSSQATANVRRNSEQYRALIADEPQIGRIADALGGEVVIVWKGRAYRIR
jgi:hypothetical protein